MVPTVNRNLCWDWGDRGMSDMAGRHGPWPPAVGALLLLAGMWTQEGWPSWSMHQPFVATLPISADNDLYQRLETRSATFSTTDTATCDCTGIRWPAGDGLLPGHDRPADPADPLGTLISSTLFRPQGGSSTRQGIPDSSFNATTSGFAPAPVSAAC